MPVASDHKGKGIFLKLSRLWSNCKIENEIQWFETTIEFKNYCKHIDLAKPKSGAFTVEIKQMHITYICKQGAIYVRKSNFILIFHLEGYLVYQIYQV